LIAFHRKPTSLTIRDGVEDISAIEWFAEWVDPVFLLFHLHQFEASKSSLKSSRPSRITRTRPEWC
ncbi:hypothetical protein Celaphus_00011843, partial [Cervus elaphus hippelaphus]